MAYHTTTGVHQRRRWNIACTKVNKPSRETSAALIMTRNHRIIGATPTNIRKAHIDQTNIAARYILK